MYSFNRKLWVHFFILAFLSFRNPPPRFLFIHLTTPPVAVEMNAFIDLSKEEQLVDLVNYTGTLLEDSTFAPRLTPLIAAGQDAEVLDELIQQSNVYYKSGKDIESLFNSISRLICMVKPEQSAALVRKLTSALASDDIAGHEPTRLKILGTLFNNLEVASPSRYDTFLNLLSLIARTGSVSSISSQLPKLDAWIPDWHITVDQTRVLYKKLVDVLKACRQNKLSSEVLIKYIATFNGATSDAYAAVKADAVNLISQVLVDSETFEFNNILALGAVQQLKTEKIFELLSLFAAGSFTRYLAFQQANSAWLTASGISEDALSQKVRLLTLSALFAAQSEVSYATIATTLAVPETEVERWVIDVIRAGLVEAKVDQVHQKVLVSRSTHTKFDRAEWELVKERLHAWTKHISEVQKVLNGVKAQARPQPVATPAAAAMNPQRAGR